MDVEVILSFADIEDLLNGWTLERGLNVRLQTQKEAEAARTLTRHQTGIDETAP